MFRSNSLSIILLASSFMAFSPLSTDMFAPALPTIGKDLGVSIPAVQATLSTYLIAFAVGQLIWGPLADRFGRKPIIVTAVSIYVFASVACMFSPNIEILIIARVFQGLGVSFGQVLARAVIRDLHTPEQTPRVMAYSTTIMGITSLISPNIGAVIVVTVGWRIVFGLLTLYALFLVLIVLAKFNESIPAKDMKAVRPLQLFRNFAILLKDAGFTRYAISVSCIFGLLFSFVFSAPFVFIDVLGVPTAKFGLVFTAVGGAFVVASAITGKVVSPERTPTIFLVALISASIGGAVALGIAVLAPSVVGLIIPIMVITFSMGFIVPIGFAQSMANHPQIAGTASTLVGFMQGIFGATMGALTGILFDGTAVPMAAIIATLATLALISYLFIRPYKKL